MELTPFEINIIATKYAFIVNKLNIHQIYNYTDYDNAYEYISNYLIIIEQSKYLKYIITMKIIDTLFDKALTI